MTANPREQARGAKAYTPRSPGVVHRTIGAKIEAENLGA